MKLYCVYCIHAFPVLVLVYDPLSRARMWSDCDRLLEVGNGPMETTDVTSSL